MHQTRLSACHKILFVEYFALIMTLQVVQALIQLIVMLLFSLLFCLLLQGCNKLIIAVGIGVSCVNKNISLIICSHYARIKGLNQVLILL